jgi:protein SCO1/2
MVLSGLVGVWWFGPGRAAGIAARLPVLGEVPAFRLIDASGAVAGRGELAGKPWIAGLVFTRCRTSCPLVVERMDALGAELGEGVWTVGVSVDPAHDTPERLRAFAAAHDAREPSWVFLTGGEEEVRRLVVEGFKLGVARTPEDDPRAELEPITHSTKLVLVDGAGRIRGYYDALDPAANEALVAHARALAAAPGAAPAPAGSAGP